MTFRISSSNAPKLRLLLLFIGVVGCGGDGSDTGADSGATDRLQVTATVGMVADLVREIGGDRVDVRQLMGPGVDPHLYTVTRDDVRTILAADVLFYVGHKLEGRMTEVLASSATERTTVAVGEQISPNLLIQPEGADGHPDPHLWMDALLWSETCSVIADALAAEDPDHANEFATRAASLTARLQMLHRYGKEVMETVPPAHRLLITSHDAFNYFGRAYDIEVTGIQGLSTESEAGLQRVNELVDLITARSVPCVFVESSVPSRSVESLLEGAADRNHKVTIGGELYSDAMGEAGTWEGTYIGMLDHNLTTVAAALGGNPPDGGFRAWEQANAAEGIQGSEVDEHAEETR